MNDFSLFRYLEFESDCTELFNQIKRNHLEFVASELSLILRFKKEIKARILSMNGAELNKIVSDPDTLHFITEYYSEKNETIFKHLQQYVEKTNIPNYTEINESSSNEKITFDNENNNRILLTKSHKNKSLYLDKNSNLSVFESSRVKKNLESTLELIKKTSIHAYYLIVLMTETIGVVKNDSFPSDFNSASCRSKIGRILLVNPHLKGVTYPVLVNALIHESVHSLLYRIEMNIPIFKSNDSNDSHFLESPWTGNILRAITYVHACFVYFGLNSYWRNQSKHQFSQETINQNLKKIDKGFSSSLYKQNFSFLEDKLSPFFLGSLEKVNQIYEY